MPSLDIKKLSELARLELSAEEEQSLQGDLGKVVDYVSRLEDMPFMDEGSTHTDLRNVLRDDTDAFLPDSFGEISKNMPDVQNGFLKVKKILS